MFSLACHTFDMEYASAAQYSYRYLQNTHNVHQGKCCMLLSQLWPHKTSCVQPQRMNRRTWVVSRNLTNQTATGACLSRQEGYDPQQTVHSLGGGRGRGLEISGMQGVCWSNHLLGIDNTCTNEKCCNHQEIIHCKKLRFLCYKVCKAVP